LCSGYFGDRVLLFAQTGLDHDALIVSFLLLLEWQVCTTTPCFYPFRWGLMNFFLPGLAWNFCCPNLNLLHSLGWKVCAITPSYGLRCGVCGGCLSNFLSGLASNQDSPYFNLLNSKNYRCEPLVPGHFYLYKIC
jgi:hypothetical protein